MEPKYTSMHFPGSKAGAGASSSSDSSAFELQYTQRLWIGPGPCPQPILQGHRYQTLKDCTLLPTHPQALFLDFLAPLPASTSVQGARKTKMPSL